MFLFCFNSESGVRCNAELQRQAEPDPAGHRKREEIQSGLEHQVSHGAKVYHIFIRLIAALLPKSDMRFELKDIFW